MFFSDFQIFGFLDFWIFGLSAFYGTLRDLTGPYWTLLDPIGPYWTLLNPKILAKNAFRIAEGGNLGGVWGGRERWSRRK